MFPVKEINEMIISSASNEDLNALVESIKLRREILGHKMKTELGVGSRVKFRGKGMDVLGKITKYNRKTASVLSDTGQNWRVSITLLSAA